MHMGLSDPQSMSFARTTQSKLALIDMYTVMGALQSDMLRGGADEAALQKKLNYEREESEKGLANAWAAVKLYRERDSILQRIIGGGRAVNCAGKSQKACARSSRSCTWNGNRCEAQGVYNREDATDRIRSIDAELLPRARQFKDLMQSREVFANPDTKQFAIEQCTATMGAYNDIYASCASLPPRQREACLAKQNQLLQAPPAQQKSVGFMQGIGNAIWAIGASVGNAIKTVWNTFTGAIKTLWDWRIKGIPIVQIALVVGGSMFAYSYNCKNPEGDNANRQLTWFQYLNPVGPGKRIPDADETMCNGVHWLIKQAQERYSGDLTPTDGILAVFGGVSTTVGIIGAAKGVAAVGGTVAAATGVAASLPVSGPVMATGAVVGALGVGAQVVSKSLGNAYAIRQKRAGLYHPDQQSPFTVDPEDIKNYAAANATAAKHFVPKEKRPSRRRRHKNKKRERQRRDKYDEYDDEDYDDEDYEDDEDNQQDTRRSRRRRLAGGNNNNGDALDSFFRHLTGTQKPVLHRIRPVSHNRGTNHPSESDNTSINASQFDDEAPQSEVETTQDEDSDVPDDGAPGARPANSKAHPIPSDKKWSWKKTNGKVDLSFFEPKRSVMKGGGNAMMIYADVVQARARAALPSHLNGINVSAQAETLATAMAIARIRDVLKTVPAGVHARVRSHNGYILAQL